MPAYFGYCTADGCGARHEIGLELEPEERGCMCGGDVKPISEMTEDEAIAYRDDWMEKVRANE